MCKLILSTLLIMFGVSSYSQTDTIYYSVNDLDKKFVELKQELNQLKFTKKNLARKKIDLKNFIKKYKKKNNQVAIFGTGHAACLFINLFKIKNLIDFAIDDNLKKTGYFIPGSKIPIYNSKILKQKKIKLCILGVSSDSEMKILKKHKSFIKKGSFFASIYPSSKYAIRA